MNTTTMEILPIGALFDQILGPIFMAAATNAAVPRPAAKSTDDKQVKFYPLPKMSDGGFYCPPVARVIFNEDATIVTFKDGTKSSVVREAGDAYDRTTAVAYAIVKRVFATAFNSKTHAVNAAYINTIRDLAENGYDQKVEEAKNAKRNRTAQAEHEARQKAIQEKAFKRRVKNRVRELQVEAAAKAELAGNKKPLNEDVMSPAKFFGYGEPTNSTSSKGTVRTSGLAQVDPKDAWKFYTRPNKPFSQFTDAEKREYWRAHSGKRRAQKR